MLPVNLLKVISGRRLSAVSDFVQTYTYRHESLLKWSGNAPVLEWTSPGIHPGDPAYRRVFSSNRNSCIFNLFLEKDAARRKDSKLHTTVNQNYHVQRLFCIGSRLPLAC